MARVFLSLGSNLGHRLGFLQRAVEAIDQLPDTEVVRVSKIYETEPVGMREQPDFLNAAVEITTTLAPAELLKRLKAIEREVGRLETFRYGPREIDIDILYYDGITEHLPDLEIPHPEIGRRRFVLAPLCDLAPELIDPVAGLRVDRMLRECPDGSRVELSTSAIPWDRKEP
jgi:2-amino-4-hydroxy-6-hydroxymethyldihydropteridine diphosphokinase